MRIWALYPNPNLKTEQMLGFFVYPHAGLVFWLDFVYIVCIMNSVRNSGQGLGSYAPVIQSKPFVVKSFNQDRQRA